MLTAARWNLGRASAPTDSVPSRPMAAGTATGRDDDARRRAAIDTALVAAIAVALLGLFVGPTLRDGHVFPVGPDVPVYLWWSRVAMDQGVSAVGERPGIVALLPTVSGVLRVGLVPALAGLLYAVGPAVGMAGAALVRGRRGGAVVRGAWVAGGLLAGVWATHLADGYAANLALAAPFIAAAVALTRRSRHGTIGAAILLAGGGLMHPEFLIVGSVVLLLTAGWAALREHRQATPTGDAERVLAALGAGVGTAVLGMWAASLGPSAIAGDTSKDALLRRIGAWDALRATFIDRFRISWPRYAPIMNTLLDVAGAVKGRGFPRRFLVSWLAFTLVAVVTGVLTGWFPPDRVLTFAFCIPLLASLGLAWLAERIGRGWIAWPVGIVLVILTAAPTVRGWQEARTFISPDELRTATLAGRIAATTPPGTPLVFVVDDPETPTLFLASHARNVARATVPPDRAADVWIALGRADDVLAGRVTQRGDPLVDRAAVDAAVAIPRDPAPVVFVVQEFDARAGALEQPGLTRWDPGLAANLGPATTLPAGEGELSASTPGDLAGAAVRTLLLLTLLGGGWALWSIGDGPGALATAPAFGIAVLGLASLGLERLGAGLGSGGVATLASALAGGGGYALWLVGRTTPRHRDGGQDLLVEGEPDPDA